MYHIVIDSRALTLSVLQVVVGSLISHGNKSRRDTYALRLLLLLMLNKARDGKALCVVQVQGEATRHPGRAINNSPGHGPRRPRWRRRARRQRTRYNNRENAQPIPVRLATHLGRSRHVCGVLIDARRLAAAEATARTRTSAHACVGGVCSHSRSREGLYI
jgi:hypothetical protein